MSFLYTLDEKSSLHKVSLVQTIRFFIRCLNKFAQFFFIFYNGYIQPVQYLKENAAKVIFLKLFHVKVSHLQIRSLFFVVVGENVNTSSMSSVMS